MTAPPIVREVLPNGLRLLTVRMPPVRAVSSGVWLALQYVVGWTIVG